MFIFYHTLTKPGDPPGLVEITKQGRVVGGSVGWTVTPTTGGSDIA